MIRSAVKKLRDRFVGQLEQKLEQQERMMMSLADANFRTRAMIKRSQNKPIRIVFVCHLPSLWNMFDTVYKAAVEDPDFDVTVVALPYKHDSLAEGQYKDDGAFEYLNEKQVRVINGFDKAKDEWLNPAVLHPDYVFFQTPYRNFPDAWSIENVSMIARICYVPYGGCIYAGDVDEIVNPISFFARASMVFKENQYTKDKFLQRFKNESWLFNKSVYVSGCPKLDFLDEERSYSGTLWRRGLQKDVQRIFWTPRWNTAEGNCHFFEYRQFFIDFCKDHQMVDFIFRPHPLSLQHFMKTGELSSSELEAMESAYEQSSNMVIDKGGGYEDTFVTSDFLVSDMSTILFEYFATGKPIIYTHRVDHFNELGKELSEGFYWVTNSSELAETMEMLISGIDPLKPRREEIRKALYFKPEGGAGLFIKEAILKDFGACVESA